MNALANARNGTEPANDGKRPEPVIHRDSKTRRPATSVALWSMQDEINAGDQQQRAQ